MHSAVADALRAEDPFFFQTVSKNVGDFVIFTSPYFKWIANLFTSPFESFFSFALLDVTLTFGHWSFIEATVAIITAFRDQLITIKLIERIEKCFDTIAKQKDRNVVLSILRRVYEFCLRSNVQSILQFQKQHVFDYSVQAEEREVVDVGEQNGIVSDLYSSTASEEKKHDLRVSSETPFLSKHMRKLTESLKRVNGYETHDDGYDTSHSRRSSTLNDSEHIPSFNDFTDKDEESEEDNWRLSFINESVADTETPVIKEEVSDEKEECAMVEKKKEEDQSRSSSSSTKRFSINLPLALKQADQLISKVGLMYDNLTERHVYRNVFSGKDRVVGFTLLDSCLDGWSVLYREFDIGERRLSRFLQ